MNILAFLGRVLQYCAHDALHSPSKTLLIRSSRYSGSRHYGTVLGGAFLGRAIRQGRNFLVGWASVRGATTSLKCMVGGWKPPFRIGSMTQHHTVPASKKHCDNLDCCVPRVPILSGRGGSNRQASSYLQGSKIAADWMWETADLPITRFDHYLCVHSVPLVELGGGTMSINDQSLSLFNYEKKGGFE